MTFIHDGFLLHSAAARRLYAEHAAGQPVFDYHSHLPPADIADDRQFRNLFEIWLEGDHYKWRAMRANGVPETLLHRRRGPVREVQGVGGDRAHAPAQSALPLDASRAEAVLRHRRTARRIHGGPDLAPGQRAARSRPSCRRRGILQKFGVQVLCTTDDPADDLAQSRCAFVPPTSGRGSIPTFRPDRALDVHLPEVFNPWVDRLAAGTNIDISRFSHLLDALRKRHDDFHAAGGRLSDHGLSRCPVALCTESDRRRDFRQGPRRAGGQPPRSSEGFSALMMHFFGRLDAEKGWTKQLHLGARRNASTRGFESLGPRHRLRLDRRLAAGRRARPSSSTGSTRRTRCRRRSSTTSIPPTTTSSRRWSAISRTEASRARSSSAAAGGFSIRRKGWSGSSMRSRTPACCRTSSA